MKNLYIFYRKYIKGINNIVLIGNEEIGQLIKANKNIFEIKIQFINEKSLIDVDKIKNIIYSRSKGAIKRSGWYVQQFVKMQYSKICKEKFYLIFDSDTIPVKGVSMFSEKGKPYFDVSKRYVKPYFETMKTIFPELGKIYNYSFVTEHMLIKTEIMKELIHKIENNTNLNGDNWYEKIINSINIEYLNNIGFSEYETFGTFTNFYYNNLYKIRKWKSLRYDNYYKPKSFTFKNSNNVSKKYDAISFEH